MTLPPVQRLTVRRPAPGGPLSEPHRDTRRSLALGALVLGLWSLVLSGGSALAQDAAPGAPVGQLVENVASRQDPTQTYTLYLPTGYTFEDARPALVILDPRGRGSVAAEIFRQGAERHGWILVSANGTRSDGDAEPNVQALEGLFPDLARRWGVDPRRVYLAAMSGTAVVALGVAQGTGAIAGVITAAGPHVPNLLTGELRFAHFGTVGRSDFNFVGMRTVDEELGAAGVPHRLAVFDAGHGWMSPALASEALAWMELQAMRTGLVPVDAELVRAQFLAGRGQARALEAEGRLGEAARRYREVLRTFRGLVGEPNLAPLEDKVSLLTADPAFGEERKTMARWDAEEARLRRTLGAVARDLRLAARSEGRPLSAEALKERLQLDSLLARAESPDGAVPSYETLAARRMLATIAAQTGFYLRREMEERKAYRELSAVLEVAASIPPVSPELLVDLARAHARSGRQAPAYEALGRALDAGYDDLEALRGDPGLESLRGTEEWEKLIARLPE